MQPIYHDVWILIPAYNEEISLRAVIDDLQQEGWNHILVVCDGSLDATESVARAQGVTVVSLVMNRGQGAALRAGFEYLQSSVHPRIIVTFDADGQHHAEDVANVIRPIGEGRADIVLGSRFLHPDSQVPLARKIILKLGLLYTMLVSDIFLTDTHNGFRAFNEKAYTALKITQRGMEHASEIIDQIKQKRLRFVEVPVLITYNEKTYRRKQGTSNFIHLGVKTLLRKITS